MIASYKYFFYKYFDKNLKENRERELDYPNESYDEFEWYLTDNFYTYETIEKMLVDIDNVALLLQNDYDNEYLTKIKEDFSPIYMMTEEENNKYLYYKQNDEVCNKLKKEHINVVIDFYNRFTARMRKMLNNAKQYNIISIMGP